jgi:hypothetical protein
MAFSDDELRHLSALLDPWLERRVPIMVRDQLVVQYRVKRHDVLLFEKRPHRQRADEWIESPVAKFRFNRRRGLWTLLWRDRNLEWHIYDLLDPVANLGVLVDEVDRDPTGIFWG